MGARAYQPSEAENPVSSFKNPSTNIVTYFDEECDYDIIMPEKGCVLY